jgi:hypothetical protein
MSGNGCTLDTTHSTSNCAGVATGGTAQSHHLSSFKAADCYSPYKFGMPELSPHPLNLLIKDFQQRRILTSTIGEKKTSVTEFLNAFRNQIKDLTRERINQKLLSSKDHRSVASDFKK